MTAFRWADLIFRARLVRLSLGQIVGLVTSSVGSFVMWWLAARTFPPATIGETAGVVAFGTLVATVCVSGLGQYLLTTLGATSSVLRRRLALGTILGGAVASMGIAAVAHAMLDGHAGRTVLASVALFAFGLSVTTLQDSVYVVAGIVVDLAAKAITLNVVRIGAVGVVALLEPNLTALLLAIVLPQVVVGVGWALIRSPRALRQIEQSEIPDEQRRRVHVLGVSYLYALAIALVTFGLPALVTNGLSPQDAAIFYIVWMLASILSIVASAVANTVVATALPKSLMMTNIRRLVLPFLGAEALLAIGLAIVGPVLLSFFGDHYAPGHGVLFVLIAGQFCSAVAVLLVAIARQGGSPRFISLLISLWVGGVAVTIAGVAIGSLVAVARTYALGSAAATGMIAIAVVRYASSSTEPARSHMTPILARRDV